MKKTINKIIIKVTLKILKKENLILLNEKKLISK
jgi:hypothetical protein